MESELAGEEIRDSEIGDVEKMPGGRWRRVLVRLAAVIGILVVLVAIVLGVRHFLLLSPYRDLPHVTEADLDTNKASRKSICCPALVLNGSRRQSVPRSAPMRKPSMMITVVVSLRLFIVLYRVITSFLYCNGKGCVLLLSVRPYYSLFGRRIQHFF